MLLNILCQQFVLNWSKALHYTIFSMRILRNISISFASTNFVYVYF